MPTFNHDRLFFTPAFFLPTDQVLLSLSSRSTTPKTKPSRDFSSKKKLKEISNSMPTKNPTNIQILSTAPPLTPITAKSARPNTTTILSTLPNTLTFKLPRTTPSIYTSNKSAPPSTNTPETNSHSSSPKESRKLFDLINRNPIEASPFRKMNRSKRGVNAYPKVSITARLSARSSRLATTDIFPVDITAFIGCPILQYRPFPSSSILILLSAIIIGPFKH
jgi:hypothetical protein